MGAGAWKAFGDWDGFLETGGLGKHARPESQSQKKNGASIRVLLLLGAGELAAGSFLDMEMEVGASRAAADAIFFPAGEDGGKAFGRSAQMRGDPEIYVP